MTLSIIIINWNSQKLLLNCLRSIRKHVSGLSYEVIVIDNNSHDQSVVRVRAFIPKVKIISNKKNFGFAYAVNQGLRAGRGQIFLVLNPDVVIRKSAVNRLVERITSDKTIGAVGPKLISAAHEPWPYVKFPTFLHILLFHTLLRPIARRFWFILKHVYLAPDGEVDLIPGGCLMLKKTVVQKVGYFDTRFPLWFEDTDYCYRMKKRGFRLVKVDSAVITHVTSGSTNKLSRYQFFLIHYASMFRYFSKHYGSNYANCTLLIMMLDQLVSIPLGSNGNYPPIGQRLKLVVNWTKILFGVKNVAVLPT